MAKMKRTKNPADGQPGSGGIRAAIDPELEFSYAAGGAVEPSMDQRMLNYYQGKSNPFGATPGTPGTPGTTPGGITLSFGGGTTGTTPGGTQTPGGLTLSFGAPTTPQPTAPKSDYEIAKENYDKYMALQKPGVDAYNKSVGLRQGGPVRGPGGPRDDKIPARLSNGEYVLPAAVVEALGGSGVLDDLVRRMSGREPGGEMKGGVLHAESGAPANSAIDEYNRRGFWGNLGAALTSNGMQGGGRTDPAPAPDEFTNGPFETTKYRWGRGNYLGAAASAVPETLASMVHGLVGPNAGGMGVLGGGRDAQEPATSMAAGVRNAKPTASATPAAPTPANTANPYAGVDADMSNAGPGSRTYYAEGPAPQGQPTTMEIMQKQLANFQQMNRNGVDPNVAYLQQQAMYRDQDAATRQEEFQKRFDKLFSDMRYGLRNSPHKLASAAPLLMNAYAQNMAALRGDTTPMQELSRYMTTGMQGDKHMQAAQQAAAAQAAQHLQGLQMQGANAQALEKLRQEDPTHKAQGLMYQGHAKAFERPPQPHDPAKVIEQLISARGIKGVDTAKIDAALSQVINGAAQQYGGGQGQVAPPAAAIEALRQQPEQAAAFDQKYGRGASKQYLGG